MARTGPHEVVAELAAQASIPVINGLTIREHPCQALADLFTINEQFGDCADSSWRSSAMGTTSTTRSRSLGATLGLEVRLAHPPGLRAQRARSSRGRASWRLRAAGGSSSRSEPAEAVRGAAVVYTDAWTSMGQEAEAEERREAFAGYQVNAALLGRRRPTPRVMHCLPAHRGEEITSDVMDGPRSLILEQSENRLHAQKAFLVECLGG